MISEKWREDYNENHPHGSLCGMSPRQYTRVKNQGDFEKEIFGEKSKLTLFGKG